jgi:hypothetical protein
MATVIKIKRSTGGDVPGSLSAGELAVTYGSSGTGPKRLFVGNAAGNGLIVVGGEVFADMLDHTAGTLTASSALLADSNSAMSSVVVGNNASAAGTVVFNEGTNNGTAKITLTGVADVGASNRTLTLPNATDTLVGKATTDTLTNKTLTSPTINTPTITGDTTFSDGAYDFNIASHDTSNGLKLGGTLVSATAAELNLIDGSSAGTVVNSKAVIYSGTGTIAGTLSTAAQASVTSLGTLTTLTVDNIRINGTTIGHTGDTDLLTFASAALTLKGTLTVGVDDTGHDVKLFGATSGKSWLWDESANKMIIAGESQLTGTLTVGVDDTGHDVKLFGATASRYWLWDESADGVVQRGTLTVGVDDTGHDVKLFGATSGKNWLWDESADKMIITGESQLTGTLTVGVNDTGHDVKFFGATSGAYMLWDEDVDDLILAGAARAVVPDGQLVLGSTAVSSTAAELNLLDGSSAGSVVNSKGVIYSGTGTIAGTLSTVAQTNITSLGTLSALTVDNVAINGSNIGHTGDTDLMTVASGILTVAGEVQMTTLDIGGTNVASTAAELNIVDGSTSATSTTLAAADRVVVNDAGTMVQVAMSDFETFMESNLDTLSSVTTVGALDSGSITSGFGNINNGSSTITTTGAITGGSLVADNLTIDANTLSSTNSNGNIVLDPNGSGTVDVNTSRITGVTDPTGAQDAATKAYVDAVKTGLDIKDSVRVTTAAVLPNSPTYAHTTGIITAGSNVTINTAGIDGVTDLAVNDRVLVKNQSETRQNGIFTVSVVGSGTAAWTLTRATDADAPAELTGGTFTFCEEGSANSENGYVFTHDGTPVLTNATLGNNTALTIAQFSGAGQVIAGTGLTKSGNTINAIGTADRISVGADAINIDTGYVGQTSLTTLGTITTGTWQSTDVGVAYGGTGASTFTSNGVLYGNGTGAVQVTAAGTDTYFLYSNSGTPAWTNTVDGGTF